MSIHPLTQKALLNHYSEAISESNSHVKFYMSDNLTEWYIMIHGIKGNDDEFVGGEYVVKLIAPASQDIGQSYPTKPPRLIFLTPNGVFNPEENVCISIGEFHSEKYPSAIGMHGFANQLISTMIGWKDIEHALAYQATSLEEKKKLAAESKKYNREKLGEITARIEESYENYKQNWEKKEASGKGRSLLARLRKI